MEVRGGGRRSRSGKGEGEFTKVKQRQQLKKLHFRSVTSKYFIMKTVYGQKSTDFS